MRTRNRIYPPNCTICDLNPSRFLAFRKKQREVEAEYGFRLGVKRRTEAEREGYRRYMRDWRRRYRAAHKEEIDAYRSEWLEKRKTARREVREAKRAEREAAKNARRVAWEEKCRIVKEQYGFDLGIVPIEMSPEEAEARKRYERDQGRAYRESHKTEIAARNKAYQERRRLKRERRKRNLASLAKAREAQKELKRQREAEAKAAKLRAFEEKQRIVREKYGFTLGRTPITPEEIAGHARYVADRDRAYFEANREKLIAKDKERRHRKAEKRRRLLQQKAERAARREEAKRNARESAIVEARQRREAAAAAIAESTRQAEATFANEREANRAAYLAAKVAMRERGTGNGERAAGGSCFSATADTPVTPAPPVPPVPSVPVVPSVPIAPAINIADYLPHHPLRGMTLDDTAPTETEIEREAATPGWADYADDEQSSSSLLPLPSSLSSGGMPPNEPPAVATGGTPPDDPDDERRREREERIRRIREQYGFTLGKKPETQEEIEGKTRYEADRNRETAIRNREIDFMLHGRERARKAAVKKRKATIARKRREAAAQAARAAKEAEREARRKEREEARQAAREAKLAALEAERKERAEFKAMARGLHIPLQKARWTPQHQAIWDRAVRRKAKAEIAAGRDERRKERQARQAAEAGEKAERAKALEEKRRIIREKYGFTLGKKPVTPEEIEGRHRYDLDKMAEERERHRDRITAYNRDYRRRKRQEALAEAQAKWTPKQWAEWQKRQDSKDRGSPAWLVKEVAKFLAEDSKLPVDDVMAWIIEHGGIDFLVKGAESMGKSRCQSKATIHAAARAVALFIDPDNAVMFADRATGNGERGTES